MHKLTISTNCAILRYRKYYTRERQRTADAKTVRNIWWIYTPCKPASETPSLQAAVAAACPIRWVHPKLMLQRTAWQLRDGS